MTLFLDIDGVLNTNETLKRSYGKHSYREFCKHFSSIDEKLLNYVLLLDITLCKELDDFISRNNISDIVIHSSWTKVLTLKELQFIFYVKGFPKIADIISDILCCEYTGSRIETIENYVKINKIEKYYTMDDGLLDYPRNKLLDTLYHYYGISKPEFGLHFLTNE